jgi:protein-S-isoprenylcysteine O-methyltransferase Ste14
MKKMDFFGVGPKIGRALIPWWAITILLSCISNWFTFTPEKSTGLAISGAFLLLFGLSFYFYSVQLLLNGLKEGKLVTHGTFYLCQNPLYISFVLFLIPATALLLNSWLVLTTSVVGFILMKVYVGNEYQILEEAFGDEYRNYKAETPEYLPFPAKKWFRKTH